MIQITSDIRRAICFNAIADHRYVAIGHHLKDAHGNIDLLNESHFRMLKKCSTKWDCLVYEMLLYIIYSSLHYIYSISYINFHLLDNDVLETSKRRAVL